MTCFPTRPGYVFEEIRVDQQFSAWRQWNLLLPTASHQQIFLMNKQLLSGKGTLQLQWKSVQFYHPENFSEIHINYWTIFPYSVLLETLGECVPLSGHTVETPSHVIGCGSSCACLSSQNASVQANGSVLIRAAAFSEPAPITLLLLNVQELMEPPAILHQFWPTIRS